MRAEPRSIAVPILLVALCAWPVPDTQAQQQCWPFQFFASVGNNAAHEIQLELDPTGYDDSGNEIGRFWASSDSTIGSSFSGGGSCPSAGPAGWWITTMSGHRGIKGILGYGDCVVSTCPTVADDEMIFVVEEWGPAGPPGVLDTASFVAFRVNGIPDELRVWDLARVVESDTVMPLREFPQPSIFNSSNGPNGYVHLGMTYPDIEPNVHAVSAGETPLPASSVVVSYDLYLFVGPAGSSEPGRLAVDWTRVDQLPYQDEAGTGQVLVPCSTATSEAYLALGVSFEGGAGPDVPSTLVGPALHVPCDYVDPPTPAGAIPDGHAVPGEQVRVDKTENDYGLILILTWGEACMEGDFSFAIYEGALRHFTSHQPVTCLTSGSQSHAFFAPSGNTYYLVVPWTDPVDPIHFNTAEGSYGLTSEGVERPQSINACLPQNTEGCF